MAPRPADRRPTGIHTGSPTGSPTGSLTGSPTGILGRPFGNCVARAVARGAACGLLFATCLAPPASGQPGDDGGAAAAANFFDVVDVQIVNVEVVVTDRKGNPVAGLQAEDFEIFDDGEPVEITNFFASHDVAAPVPDQTLDQITAEAEDLPAVPADQRLNLVIFIDNENISPQNRNRVVNALQGSLFFDLRPSDRVTVVSNDGSINIRQNLTSDPNRLARVLDEMTEGSSRGAQLDFDRLKILRDLQRTDLEGSFGSGAGLGQSEGDWQAILSEIRTFAEREHGEVSRTLQLLATFVDTLAGLEGRKALIYVSDGLSIRPGEALFQAFDDKLLSGGGTIRSPFNVQSESRQYDLGPAFEALGKQANAGRVTFYTILATGGRSRGLTPAERSAFVDIGAPASSLGQVWTETLDEVQTSNYRASMETLAAATGGVSTLSTRNFAGALDRVQQDLRSYYSLGYEAREADGRDHRIEVKLKNRKLRARYRESYRQRPVEQRMAVRTKSALMFGTTDNPLGVQVQFGPTAAGEKGKIHVPVIVKFPLSEVVLTPGESSHDGKVTIYVGARAVGGGLSPVQQMPAPIRVPADKLEAALEQVAGYRMMLAMRPGQHLVAVTVRDELAQVESSIVTSYDAKLPAPAAGR